MSRQGRVQLASFALLAVLSLWPAAARPGLVKSLLGGEDIPNQAALPLRFVFPQIGNGDGFRTALVLYNTGANASVRVEFFNSAGNPLSLNLSGLGNGSSFNIQLSKGEAFSTETSGEGAIQAGYALVFAPAGVDGTAVFTLAAPQEGSNLFEAGVPATSTTRNFSIYFDSRGNRRTGLALVNARAINGEATVHATLRLYTTGFQMLAQRTVNLTPGAHLAEFVDRLFEEAARREGSLTVTTDLPVAAVTLRQNLATVPGPTLTAFPVIPARADDPAGSQDPAERIFFFPQVGDGRVGDIVFRTTLILVNTGPSDTARVEFFNSDGSPLALPLGNLGTNSVFDIQLGQGASFSAQTTGTGGLQVGYAQVTTGARVGGSAVFTRSTPGGLILYEAGVAAATPLNAFTLVADLRGFRDTGLALVSPSQSGAATQGVSATMRLYDENFQLLQQTPLTLPPGHHQAEFVTQAFNNARQVLNGQLGSVTIQTDEPLAALTLRQTDRPIIDFPDEIPTLTTFPVILGRADSSTNADVSILKTGPATPISGGSQVTYSVFISNGGPDVAQNINVTDPLPPGTQFVSAGGAGWSCQNAFGTVTCSRSQLDVQAAPVILIDLIAPSQPQTVVNTARVTTVSADPDPGNNSSSSATTVVPPQIDMSVSIQGDSDASAGAGPIAYTVTVRNESLVDATGVTMTSNFITCTAQGIQPSQCQNLGAPLLEVTNVTLLDGGLGRACQHGLDTVTCNLATVRQRTNVRIMITLDFDNSVLGRSILHTANVVATNPDPLLTNNTRGFITDVVPNEPRVDLSVSTIATPNPALPGAELTYILNVFQAGPGVATAVRLRDTLSPQVSFVRATISPSDSRCSNLPRSCSFSEGVVTCDLATMCVGNRETVRVVVSVPQSSAGSSLLNRTTVSSAAGDVETNPSNNTSNVATPVSN